MRVHAAMLSLAESERRAARSVTEDATPLFERLRFEAIRMRGQELVDGARFVPCPAGQPDREIPPETRLEVERPPRGEKSIQVLQAGRRLAEPVHLEVRER